MLLSSVYLLPWWAHVLLLFTLEPPALLFSVQKFPKHQYFVSGYTMLFLQISIMLVCPKCVHLLLLICCSAEKLPCCGLTWRLLLHVDTIAGPTCYWPRKLPQGARVQRYWKEKLLQVWTSYSVMLLLSENGVKVYCNWSVLDLGNPLLSLLVFWSVIQELWAS